MNESSERWPLRKKCQQADSPCCLNYSRVYPAQPMVSRNCFLEARKTSSYSLEPSRTRKRTIAAYLRRLSRSLYSQYIVTSSYERTREDHSVVVLAGDNRSKFCLSRATQPASRRSGQIPSTHRCDHAGLERCGWPIADVSAFFGRRSLESRGRSHRYRHRKRRNGMGNRPRPYEGNARCRRSGQARR